MPTRPTDAELAGARAVVTLRLTLDDFGSVAEIRSACCGLIAVGNSLGPGDAFITATVEAVSQWRYEPPADPPISFDVTIAFGPAAEPSLVMHGGLVLRPAGPPPPPPPPPGSFDSAAWADGAMRVGGGIRPPVKIRHVGPVYPPAARAAGVQGVVIVEVRIEPDGRIQHARVLRSIPMLDQAALDAVLQWEFEPTLVNGVSTPILMNVTVQFTLPGA
jgi:TonB family protein